MVPTESEVATRDEFPQATEVSDAHEPENNWIFGWLGAELRVIVSVDACATKVYQTSFLLVAPQPVIGGVLVLAVSVPAVLIQVVDEVSEVAFAQALFAGCA